MTDRPVFQTAKHAGQAARNTKLAQMKTGKLEAFLYQYPKTLIGLETNSSYIVRGTVLEGSKEKIIQDDPQDIPYTYTETPMQIREVYKGDLAKDSVVAICEKYFIRQRDGEDILCHYENYMPCEIGKEYVFFLEDSAIRKEGEAPSYSLSFLDRSRYSILPQDGHLSTGTFRATERDEHIYQKLYKEVAAKYLDLEIN